MILGILGPEGSGKTCLLAYLALKQIALKGEILAFPGFTLTDGHGHQLSKPLETEQWIRMAPELRNVFVCIDEIQNFFNSMKHMQTLNYLFANLAAQRRHRNIGIIYTVQDWGWLDNRIRWLTHVLATCYDLYWSQWGKEEGLGRGELISVTFYDVKGFYSGKPWTPSPPFKLQAKNIWPCYDSYCDVDIWSGLSKVDIKKPTYTVDLRPPKEETEPTPAEAQIPRDPNIDHDLLNDLANTGASPGTLAKLARRLLRE